MFNSLTTRTWSCTKHFTGFWKKMKKVNNLQCVENLNKYFLGTYTDPLWCQILILNILLSISKRLSYPPPPLKSIHHLSTQKYDTLMWVYVLQVVIYLINQTPCKRNLIKSFGTGDTLWCSRRSWKGVFLVNKWWRNCIMEITTCTYLLHHDICI